MSGYTRYLLTRQRDRDRFHVSVTANTPLDPVRDAMAEMADLRYSPILPAYLIPGEDPPPLPATLTSVAFFFHPSAHHALGQLKPSFDVDERGRTFFSEGLASFLVLNCDEHRANAIMDECCCPQVEVWKLKDENLDPNAIIYREAFSVGALIEPPTFATTGLAEIDVYVEHIAASCATLWSAYAKYHPAELVTLPRVARHLHALTERYRQLRNGARTLPSIKKENAILAALVELSAALSYAVTQGTSGGAPILANRSPFPHHSLLGVGGAVRALTNFTRSLECAFKQRSAAGVIANQYATKTATVPSKIGFYDSGKPYKFPTKEEEVKEREEFDHGGEFPSADHFPLLCQFSLRHGFKESKYSVTAASESLTTECMPAWTMMTLSHEIMHSRVRHIMQALFGTSWDADEYDKQWNEWCANFGRWYQRRGESPVPISEGIRNAVLAFCLARQREDPVEAPRKTEEKKVSKTELLNAFRTHKRLATELFVHFHDYYFIYARQTRLYAMSLWASWPTVAALAARPEEYVVRTLATLACGTGAASRKAFDGAALNLLEALDQLEAVGISSPIYEIVRTMLLQQREETFAHFRPAYYLIDQVRRFFASTEITKRIDRIEEDSFASGSTVASDYTNNIYVHGENGPISPVRHSIAALVQQLSGQPLIDDSQWITAWNCMVISSQETARC